MNSRNSCLLFARSFGCGDDLVEARITAQIIPAGVEAEIAIRRAVRNRRDSFKLLERGVALARPGVNQRQVGNPGRTVDRVISNRLNLDRAPGLADRFFFSAKPGIKRRNIALGDSAGINLTTGSNNIDIGNKGVAGESKTIRIGTSVTQTKTFIAGISGVAVTGSQVLVNSNGKLGVASSSARFKEAIKAMDKASEAILALKPVTFHYKKELDPDGIPQFGLVAEQVQKVNPDLVVRDEQGKPYTVRYEAVNAMLLNEFLKEHRKVQKLEAALDAVNKRLEEQDAKIQRVSAQVEFSKPAPQIVQNR